MGRHYRSRCEQLQKDIDKQKGEIEELQKRAEELEQQHAAAIATATAASAAAAAATAEAPPTSSAPTDVEKV